MIALAQGDAAVHDRLHLLRALDALRDHLQPGLGRHRRDRGQDRHLQRIPGQAGDEAAVHLEAVDREVPEAGQRGLAGAEVVQRDLDAEFAQALQGGDRERRVGQQGGLGEFEPQPAGRQPAGLEGRGDVGHQVRLFELAGGDVDRQRQRPGCGRWPGRGGTAGHAQQPAAQRHDQAGGLGDVDDLAGGPPLVGVVAPAQQGFGPQDPPVREPRQRLVVHVQPPFLVRLAQRALQVHALHQRAVAAGVEDLAAVQAAEAARPVAGELGIAQQHVRRRRREVVRERDPGHGAQPAAATARTLDEFDAAAGQGQRVGLAQAAMGHQGEGVVAHPRQRRLLAQAFAQRRGHGHQRCAAIVIPEVDLEVDGRDRRLAAAGRAQRAVGDLEQMVAIGQVGLGVVQFEVAQAALGVVAAMDLGHHRHVVADAGGEGLLGLAPGARVADLLVADHAHQRALAADRRVEQGRAWWRPK